MKSCAVWLQRSYCTLSMKELNAASNAKREVRIYNCELCVSRVYKEQAIYEQKGYK